MAAGIERLGINKALISAAGVDLERGVSCFHFHEVAPKQAAIATAMQRLLVVDASKFGVVRPAYFAALDDFDVVVTDEKGAPQLLNGHSPDYPRSPWLNRPLFAFLRLPALQLPGGQCVGCGNAPLLS